MRTWHHWRLLGDTSYFRHHVPARTPLRILEFSKQTKPSPLVRPDSPLIRHRRAQARESNRRLLAQPGQEQPERLGPNPLTKEFRLADEDIDVDQPFRKVKEPAGIELLLGWLLPAEVADGRSIHHDDRYQVRRS